VFQATSRKAFVSSAFLSYPNKSSSPGTAVSKRLELSVPSLLSLRQQQQKNGDLDLDLASSENSKDKTEELESSSSSSPSGALWDRFSALTLAAANLTESVDFYKKLGLEISYQDDSFVTLQYPLHVPPHKANIYINLFSSPTYDTSKNWGRVVMYVKDVDDMYRLIIQQGLVPEFAPRDASWGERYFHILDPSGHELSFAKPLV